jgi:hypothetical protein
MGWMEATVLFIMGLVAFTVMISVGTELLPSMQETMGSTTTLLISAMFVIIFVVGLMVYIRQSQEPDHYMGMGGEQSY